MKRMMLIMAMMFMAVASGFSQTTVRCNTCNGYRALRCGACGGTGVVYVQVYNAFYGCYQVVQQFCGNCGGHGAVVCNGCRGYGYLIVNNGYQPSFRGKKCGGTVGCDCTKFSPVSSVGSGQYMCKCKHAKWPYHSGIL